MSANPDTTPRLGLPWLMPAQAQKHVTMNEALRRLDGIVQATAQSRTTALEPASPAEGEGWILPAEAGGPHWDGFAPGDLVIWQDAGWTRHIPRQGWQVWVVDEGQLAVFDGEAWQAAGGGLGNEVAELGIGTSPDEANPFAARLNAALWTAREAGEGGSGDLRYTLNKEASANVLSMLFQSGWEGRAEMGLVGDDDFLFKVSDDGEAWHEALRIDRSSGLLALPAYEGGAGMLGVDGVGGLLAGTHGSNGNGAYLRLPGVNIQVCWHRLNLGSAHANGAGTFDNPYRSNVFNWTYPAEFSATPAVLSHPDMGTSGTPRWYALGSNAPGLAALSNIQLVRFGNNTPSGDVFASLLAIGPYAP
ncbi:MAG: DUF2793 domain-containing protein [Glycocaulis sp.]